MIGQIVDYTCRSFTRDLLPACNIMANEPTYLEYKLRKHMDVSPGWQNEKPGTMVCLPSKTVL